MDFDYWWSCIGKGLRLQPAQQACLKKDRRVDIVQQDLSDVEIELSENEIKNTLTLHWTKFVNSKVKEAALTDLMAQNSEKSKKKNIEDTRYQSMEFMVL